MRLLLLVALLLLLLLLWLLLWLLLVSVLSTAVLLVHLLLLLVVAVIALIVFAAVVACVITIMSFVWAEECFSSAFEGNDCHEFVHFRNLLTNMTDAQKRKLIGNLVDPALEAYVKSKFKIEIRDHARLYSVAGG